MVDSAGGTAPLVVGGTVSGTDEVVTVLEVVDVDVVAVLAGVVVVEEVAPGAEVDVVVGVVVVVEAAVVEVVELVELVELVEVGVTGARTDSLQTRSPTTPPRASTSRIVTVWSPTGVSSLVNTPMSTVRSPSWHAVVTSRVTVMAGWLAAALTRVRRSPVTAMTAVVDSPRWTRPDDGSM